MNFTREPIIETVIMPREGCKLLVRNSKAAGQEEYYVESIEVVSFGRSLFFRSQERPKSFLVPVSDYEVIEIKEVRMQLKNAAPERSIKIGGGREGGVRTREDKAFDSEEREHPPMDRKQGKRRRGRRGPRPESPMRETPPPMEERSFSEEPPPTESHGEEPKAPSYISKLFPPPPTLIKDSLSRYRTAETEESEMFTPKEEKYEDVLFEPPLPESDDEETPPEES